VPVAECQVAWAEWVECPEWTCNPKRVQSVNLKNPKPKASGFFIGKGFAMNNKNLGEYFRLLIFVLINAPGVFVMLIPISLRPIFVTGIDLNSGSNVYGQYHVLSYVLMLCLPASYFFLIKSFL
jgi:hypothetical protein